MRSRWVVLAAVAAVALGACGGSADPKGDAVLKKSRAALAKVKSLEADLELSIGKDESLQGSFAGLRPNMGRVVLKGEAFGERITVSDGKNTFSVQPSEKHYQKVPSADSRVLAVLPGSPIDAFYRPEALGEGSNKYLGTRKVGGETYDVVEITPKGFPGKQRLFISPAGIPEGLEATMSAPGNELKFWLKNVRLNPPLAAARFAYTPPADFSIPKGPDDSLLPVGQPAPDFALSQPGNQGLYTLEQARKGKKAVLINFWFYG